MAVGIVILIIIWFIIYNKNSNRNVANSNKTSWGKWRDKKEEGGERDGL